MSLRARLLVVLATLAVAGLVAADVTTYAELRSFLIRRVDRTVTASTRVLGFTLARRGFADPGDLAQLASSNPGVFIGLVGPNGRLNWSPIGTPPGERPPPPPRAPSTLPAEGRTVTLHAVRGSTEFRASVDSLPNGSTLIVAAPLRDVAATLHRLLLIELLVSAAVVTAIVLVGLWLVRVGLRPLRRIEGTAAAIAAGDLTQRIADTDERTEVGRLGRALNAMLVQIERAFRERTASEARLRRFVGDASHELRTPLSSIRAYAELFDRGARDRPEDLARAMAGIEREAARMGVLVDDLLLLARLDQGRPLDRKPVDLVEVAGDAVEVARTLDPERPLRIEASGPVDVVGDPERLRQVVDNLLANVRTHTPAGSAATVRVVRDDGRAVLEVADEGPGLTAEQAERAFERFWRGDPSRRRDGAGAGLGLAIVAAIVEAHGGSVSVQSEPPQGATFRIALPSATPARS